jgi:hypothetical protein
LDFLRATDSTSPDRRYLELTPAQWACLATAALGVYIWTRRERPASPAPDPAAPSPTETDSAPRG